MFQSTFVFRLINVLLLAMLLFITGCSGGKSGQLIDFGGVRLSDPMPSEGVPVISATLGKGMLVKMSRESMGCLTCCVFPSENNPGRIGVIRFKRHGNVRDWTQRIAAMIPVKYKISYLTRMGHMANGTWIRTGKGNIEKNENLLNVFVIQEAGEDVVIFVGDGVVGGHGLVSVFSIDKAKRLDDGKPL